MFAPQQQGQGPQQDCMTTVSLWWASVPFGTKFLFVSTTILYALDWPLNGLLVYFFADIPYFTFQGHIWRVLICQFFHGFQNVIYVLGQLVNLLFSLLSIYFSAVQLERNIGTITFLVDVFVKNIFIQVNTFYNAIANIFGYYPALFIGWALSIVNSILWIMEHGDGVYFDKVYLISSNKRSFSQPDEETQFLCFPVSIKNKFYPIAIVLFVNLFAFPRLDILAAALLGYIEYRFFNGMMYRPSQNRINSLANTFLFRGCSNRPDFVSYDGRLDNNNNGGQQSQFQVNPVNAPQSQTSGQAFQEYGGKGVKIGGELASEGPKVFPQRGWNEFTEVEYPTEQAIHVDDIQQEKPQTPPQQPKTKNQQYNQLGNELV